MKSSASEPGLSHVCVPCFAHVDVSTSQSRFNSFKYYSRSFFESNNGGKTFTKITVQINTLPDHIWTPNLAR